MFVNWADKQNADIKQKVQQLQDTSKKIEDLRLQEKAGQDQKNQELENQIQQLQKDLQAKAETKKILPGKVAVAAPAPQAYSGTCADWMAQAGVADMANASELIRRESGCNPNATNRSSGAFGIPQALPASKIAYCGSDPVCQIRWMQDYVTRRYGSWANAVAFHNSHNWY